MKNKIKIIAKVPAHYRSSSFTQENRAKLIHSRFNMQLSFFPEN